MEIHSSTCSEFLRSLSVSLRYSYIQVMLYLWRVAYSLFIFRWFYLMVYCIHCLSANCLHRIVWWTQSDRWDIFLGLLLILVYFIDHQMYGLRFSFHLQWVISSFSFSAYFSLLCRVDTKLVYRAIMVSIALINGWFLSVVNSSLHIVDDKIASSLLISTLPMRAKLGTRLWYEGIIRLQYLLG